jgi:hypothetical protein
MYGPGQRSPYTDYGTGESSEDPWFDSRQGKAMFFFNRASRSALGFTPGFIEWVLGLFLSGKEAGA